MKLVAMAVVVALTTTAHAAAGDEPIGPKDETTATLLSAAGTLVPAALIGAGFAADEDSLTTLGALTSFFGPSLGHWYAGRWVTGGLAVRGVGAGVMVVGVTMELGCFLRPECESAGNEIAAAGLVLYAAGAIYDVATAGRSAREHNERLLDVGPTVIGSGGSQTLGLGVSGAF